MPALGSSHAVDKSLPNNKNVSPHKSSSGGLRRSHSQFTEYLNNADKVLDVRVNCLNEYERNQSIYQVIQTVCPFLLPVIHSSDEEDSVVMNAQSNKPSPPPLIIRPLNGGLSNELFLVSASPSSTTASASSSYPNTVLVRIHPDHSPLPPATIEMVHRPPASVGMVDRDLENGLAAWLSRQGIAPRYYGRFQNGRVEEFYPNVQTLHSSQMHLHIPDMAQQLAQFHQLEPPSDVLPKPPRGQFTHLATIRQWLYEGTADRTKSAHAALYQRLEREWQWLVPQLLHRSPSYPNDPAAQAAVEWIRQVVVTHMDAQSLNWLEPTALAGSRDQLYLIDFEYSGWNPRAADLANHFNEYCDMNNMRADYGAEYPTDEQQDAFLRDYLIAGAAGSDTKVLLSSSALAAMRLEIGRFTLLSHLGWAIWSLPKLTEESNIEYDYIAYAQHRLQGYEWAKRKFVDDC